MTIRYVGPGGNDGNSGLDWVNRKLTLNGCEDTPVVAGDLVWVGPGVYRETLTVDVDGGSTYNVGTVTVTKGSTTVTGAGTAFLANVAAGDMFHVWLFAAAADGVANGTATFTSAAGNFQANMIGRIIQINTRAPYRIGAVAAANSITLVDVNGLGWPAAAGGLTYSVMSGEGPYEIDSVTDDTNFELIRPWCVETLTGLAYLKYRPIRYVGDVTGENTDGIGGIVRITGSDNDQASVRTIGILLTQRFFRLFRGFQIDMASLYAITTSDWGGYHTFEDLYILNSGDINAAVYMRNVECITIRRCVFSGNGLGQIAFQRWAPVDDTGNVVENCMGIAHGIWGQFVRVDYMGGGTIKNCVLTDYHGLFVNTSPATGQTWVVNNCIIESNTRAGIEAQVVGDVTEDFNSFFKNGNDRINTAVGTGSVTYPALFTGPLLRDGFKYPWWPKELSEWSQIAQITGFQAACHDLHGQPRPATAAKKSWGALQFTDAERDTGTVYAGAASLVLADAGRVQFKVPCTNRAYIVRVRVQCEANYAGVNPQIVIKQPGQADRTTVDAGAAGAWNLLEDTFTPAADPEYFFVELVSNNTNGANDKVYFDNLEIRGEPQEPGEFEHWLWDRQPFDTLPANALVVSGREYRRRRVPGEVSSMEEQ